MKRTILIMLLCTYSLSLFSGCSHKDATDTAVTSETTSNSLKIDTELDTDSETESIAESKSEVPESESETSETKMESQAEVSDGVPTAPLISAEKAQEIADKGIEYIHTNNAVGIITDTTYGECMKAFAHSSEAEELGITDSDEDLIIWLETTWANGEYYHDMQTCYPFNLYIVNRPVPDENITNGSENSELAQQEVEMNFFDFQCVNPVPMTDVEVNNINYIIRYMTEYYSDDEEQIAQLPTIIDGYQFDIQRNDGFESDYDRMFVVRTSESKDKYMLDLFYAPYTQVAMGFVVLTNPWEETE